MIVFTRAWWEAVGSRVAYTALAAMLPLVALLVAGDIAPRGVLSLVAVQAVAAFATALAGLPEVTGKTVPLWRAILARTAKTLGQSLATAFAGVELLEQIAWADAWILIAGATLYTLLRTLRDWLPETAEPAIVGVVSGDGVPAVTALPGPADVPASVLVDVDVDDPPGPDHRA
jgi:hypothetical protein